MRKISIGVTVLLVIFINVFLLLNLNDKKKEDILPEVKITNYEFQLFGFGNLISYGENVYKINLITNNDELINFKNKLDGTYDNILDLDFKKYNYVAIPLERSGNVNGIDKIKDAKIDDEYFSMTVVYKPACGGIMPFDSDIYLLSVEKDINFENKKLKLVYAAGEKIECGSMIAYKPMIYLYPKDEIKVDLYLGNPSKLTTTYPHYENNWSVFANPDGTLKIGNRTYYGLYWEGDDFPAYVHDEGFVIGGDKTAEFLEEKLKIMGLTDKEANEFIVYWLPKMEQNKYNYIYFASEEEIDAYMPISVLPKPDTKIRIMMEIKPLDEFIKVKKQKIKKMKREGFTLVEWGGSIIK